jgi:glycerophosphoryl diester phosphodiesterase
MIKLLHRGNNIDHPENTLEALESALKNENVNGFETDIMLTKDKIWILFHDENLKRLTNIDKIIKNTEFNDLPKIKFNDKMYSINKLSDLSKFNYPNKVFNLEIKEKNDIDEKSKEELKNILLKLRSKILLSSFNKEWKQWCVTNNFDFAYIIEDSNLIKYDELIKYNNIIFDYDLYENNKIIINKLKKIGFYNLKKVYNKFNIEIIDYDILV